MLTITPEIKAAYLLGFIHAQAVYLAEEDIKDGTFKKKINQH